MHSDESLDHPSKKERLASVTTIKVPRERCRYIHLFFQMSQRLSLVQGENIDHFSFFLERKSMNFLKAHSIMRTQIHN
jgi:hypothetical protein